MKNEKIHGSKKSIIQEDQNSVRKAAKAYQSRDLHLVDPQQERERRNARAKLLRMKNRLRSRRAG
jgi:hypothetical protein